MVYSQPEKRLDFYVDGNLIQTIPYEKAEALDISGTSYIGGYRQGERLFKGAIDEFRLWETALDSAQIRKNGDHPLTGQEPGLLLYFNFDEIQNDTLPAVKGNGMYARLIDLQTLRPEIPRVGVRLSMPGRFENMTWYGRGPHENYCDRNTSAQVDQYESTVAEQYFPYIRPQENGYKTDIRWMTLTDETGFGLMFDGMPQFSGSALQNSIEDFDQGTRDNYRHINDIVPHDTVFVTIDMKQMGVGGDDSWGARPLPKYRIPAGDYNFRFRIFPVNAYKPSPFLLHKTDETE